MECYNTPKAIASGEGSLKYSIEIVVFEEKIVNSFVLCTKYKIYHGVQNYKLQRHQLTCQCGCGCVGTPQVAARASSRDRVTLLIKRQQHQGSNSGTSTFNIIKIRALK